MRTTGSLVLAKSSRRWIATRNTSGHSCRMLCTTLTASWRCVLISVRGGVVTDWVGDLIGTSQPNWCTPTQAATSTGPESSRADLQLAGFHHVLKYGPSGAWKGNAAPV